MYCDLIELQLQRCIYLSKWVSTLDIHYLLMQNIYYLLTPDMYFILSIHSIHLSWHNILLLQDKHEIDRMTLTMNVELPDNFSPELKHLLESLLQVFIKNTFRGYHLPSVCCREMWTRDLAVAGRGRRNSRTTPSSRGWTGSRCTSRSTPRPSYRPGARSTPRTLSTSAPSTRRTRRG